ncbi:hypothetical protein VB779_16950 [Haloarculaceae archaeon H-GB11]|nr:hypothetical protein [Haloarculaceae archaeon H-GB11]
MTGETDRESPGKPGKRGTEQSAGQLRARLESTLAWDRTDSVGVSAVVALGVVVAALAAAASVGLLAGTAHAQTTFSANDVSVTGNTGQLQSLMVAPSGTVQYSGLESAPSGATVTVSVKLPSDSSWERVGSKSMSTSGLDGTVQYDFDRIDVIDAASISRGQFGAPDGQSDTTTVEIRVEAVLAGAGPDGADVTATATDDLKVTVSNVAAGAQAGGQANAQGDAK